MLMFRGTYEADFLLLIAGSLVDEEMFLFERGLFYFVYFFFIKL